jgi:NADP-dependent 3-hydroxy acid dehydrogenase YdfG
LGEAVSCLHRRTFTLRGRPDVILNNAGLMPHSLLEFGKVEDLDRMIDVNLKGCSMASTPRCRI